MDDVNCSGSESSLFACSFRGWGQHNCGHGDDVGVDCFCKIFIVLTAIISFQRSHGEINFIKRSCLKP